VKIIKCHLLFKDVIAQKEKSAEKVFIPSNRDSALARLTSPKAKHSVLNTVAELAHTSAGLSRSSAELAHSSARLAIRVISGFRRGVGENCAIPGYHAASRPLLAA